MSVVIASKYFLINNISMFKKDKSTSTQLVALRSVRDLYINSWYLLKEKWRAIILMSLLGAIPSLLAAIILTVIVTIFGEKENFLLIIYSLALLVMWVLLYISFRINIAIYLIVAKNTHNTSEAWRLSGRYFLPYALTTLIFSLMISGWFILLLVPGFIFLVFYSLVFWVLILEDYHGYVAIQRSKELVSSYWKSVTLRLLALLVPFFIISILVEVLFKEQMADLFSSVINFFFGIFFIIYTYHLYDNLIKIKGRSQIIYKKYPAGVYVATIAIYVVLSIALYLWVISAPVKN